MGKVKTSLFLREDTDQKLEKLMELTMRGKSDVVDWLVAEKFEDIQNRELILNAKENTIAYKGDMHGETTTTAHQKDERDLEITRKRMVAFSKNDEVLVDPEFQKTGCSNAV
jgi:hypothetical protein